jgi:hypothetical protein
MRHRIHFVLAAAALVAGLVRAGDGDPLKVRHEATQILQSEFRFDPALPRPAKAPPPREVVGEREVIAMPTFTVLSSKINMRNLESDISKHQARAKAQKPKWGCGPIYQKDFGKIRFGVVSIFYIPVAIGFSW